MNDPDFYLASSEGYGLETPRRCWRVKRLATDNRDDLLLVKIDPPLLGQKYGQGNRDINLVLVATRHQGASLFPINEWPVFVHIARLLIDHPELRDTLRDDEFETVAWGELYLTEENARLNIT
jgi:hypothetical protein